MQAKREGGGGEGLSHLQRATQNSRLKSKDIDNLSAKDPSM